MSDKLKNNHDLCVCPLNSCQLYLEKPITLPCGFTICQNHIENFKNSNFNEFECVLCYEKHTIPE